MPPTYREDPYGNYNFLIEVSGISDGATARGSFSEISGLEVEIDVIEYRTGTEDITVRKLPGPKKYPNLICKRGVTGDATFWNWLLTALQGNVQRADVRISLLDESRQEVVRWNVHRAWPLQMGRARPQRRRSRRGHRNPRALPRGHRDGRLTCDHSQVTERSTVTVCSVGRRRARRPGRVGAAEPGRDPCPRSPSHARAAAERAGRRDGTRPVTTVPLPRRATTAPTDPDLRRSSRLLTQARTAPLSGHRELARR